MPQVVENFRLEPLTTTPNGYVSLKEAIEMLGKSQATIERYIASEKIASRLVSRPGRKPARVFLKESINELLEEEDRRKAARPPSAIAPKAPVVANGQALAITNFALEKIAAAGIGLTSAIEGYLNRKPDEGRISISEKPWLTLEEACDFSGLSRAWLLKHIASEQSAIAVRDMGKGTRGGRWRFFRLDLERK